MITSDVLCPCCALVVLSYHESFDPFNNFLPFHLDCSYFFNFINFSREQLTQLITNLNEQKRKLKKSGVVIDGKKYHIKFTDVVEPS